MLHSWPCSASTTWAWILLQMWELCQWRQVLGLSGALAGLVQELQVVG